MSFFNHHSFPQNIFHKKELPANITAAFKQKMAKHASHTQKKDDLFIYYELLIKIYCVNCEQTFKVRVLNNSTKKSLGIFQTNDCRC